MNKEIKDEFSGIDKIIEENQDNLKEKIIKTLRVYTDYRLSGDIDLMHSKVADQILAICEKYYEKTGEI